LFIRFNSKGGAYLLEKKRQNSQILKNYWQKVGALNVSVKLNCLKNSCIKEDEHCRHQNDCTTKIVWQADCTLSMGEHL